MKYIIALCVLVTAASASALPEYYSGQVMGPGIYKDTLSSNSAWVNPPVFGLNSASREVSLWGYQADVGGELSIDLSSTDDFVGGISIYRGEVSSSDLLLGLFNNSGDFGLVEYIAGTSTFMADSSLNDIRLGMSGFYTIVVGGKSAMGWDDAYSYEMKVTSVPEPGAWVLLLAGLFGVAVLRRRQG